MIRCFTLLIADHLVRVFDDGALAHLPANYLPFVVDDADTEGAEDFLMDVMVGQGSLDCKGLDVLVDFNDLGYRQTVYSRPQGGYVFLTYNAQGDLAVSMSSDAQFRKNQVLLAAQDEDSKLFGFNNAMMIAFAFSSAYRDTLMMHSSVVCRRGWGYMFLGTSGTGKSTHSRLWLSHISETELLNDDNPALRIKDGVAMVYGTPWSGKTPCYRQERAKVGALLMLEQKPYNKIHRQTVIESLSSMMTSVSSMMWDKASYNLLMNTMTRVIEMVGVHHLECLADEAAARLSFDTLCKD